MLRQIATLFVASLLLTGCGSPRPMSSPDNLTCNLSKFEVRDTLDRAHVYVERDGVLPELSVASPSKPVEINVLELSAGGEFGAYGAGFLNGWSSLGNKAQPIARDNIQIVTGVSAGSIVATYVFLGGLDDKIEDFYLNLTDDQVYSKHSLLGLLRANSLYDTSGKKELLRKWITSPIIDAVAQAPLNRGLYIGFTDLDTGQFVRIDMVKLARGITDKVQRDDCYRAVIDASSAIEIAFQPVFIDKHMLGDGGVRHHLFIVSPDQLAPGVDWGGIKLRLFSIIHGDLEVPYQETKNGVLDIAERSASIFTDQTLKDSIRLTNALATNPAIVVGEEQAKTLPHYETFYASAANAACECRQESKNSCNSATNSGDIFCQPFMRCLVRKGKEEAITMMTKTKWLTIEDLNLGSKSLCKFPISAQSSPNFK